MADSSRLSSSALRLPKPTATATSSASNSNPPCGACKFLRRKCVAGCIFAPHFSSDQGSARFAAVHKVFGASNVSKLLLRICPTRRHEAVVTVCYEAQARLADPVYGCVSTIMSLQHQVSALQTELGFVQSQLMNSRYALASAVQNSQQQAPPNMSMGLQPAYSNNNSCATSTNLMNMTSFINPISGFDLAAMDVPPPPSSLSLDPLQFSRLSQDEEDDEQESRIPHQVFNHDNILHP